MSNDTREAFESWLVSTGGWRAIPKKRETTDTYISGQAQARWIGWQAATAQQAAEVQALRDTLKLQQASYERERKIDEAEIERQAAELAVLQAQSDSLRAALLKVLDTREKEAKAHFAFQTASDNYSSGASREGKQHLAAMTAASNAEKEARLLLLTLRAARQDGAGEQG